MKGKGGSKSKIQTEENHHSSNSHDSSLSSLKSEEAQKPNQEEIKPREYDNQRLPMHAPEAMKIQIKHGSINSVSRMTPQKRDLSTYKSRVTHGSTADMRQLETEMNNSILGGSVVA